MVSRPVTGDACRNCAVNKLESKPGVSAAIACLLGCGSYGERALWWWLGWWLGFGWFIVAVGDVDPRLMGVKVFSELIATGALDRDWAVKTEGEEVSAVRGGGP